MANQNPYSLGSTIQLPHFASATEQFAEAFLHKMHTGSRASGVVSTIRAHVIHEGKTSQILRGSEQPDDVKMQKMEAQVEYTAKAIDRFTEENANEAIESMAQQANRQQTEMLFRTMDEVTKKTGNWPAADSVDTLLS